MTQGQPSVRYGIAVAALVCVVGIFAAARARHEYRWSAWGPGDAQSLNAARHFQQEGFRVHYLLPYFHPGYLGQVVGTASRLGYYTHYPPLSILINGVVAMLAKDKLIAFRMAAIAASVAALISWYFLSRMLFGSPVALLSTFFMATSIAFLEYIDSPSEMPYNEFFRFSAMLLFLVEAQRGSDRRGGAGLLFAVWVVVFLQSLNSFDYIIFIQVFFWGYYLLRNGLRALPYRKLLLLSTAPVAGFLLHVGQNVAALGFEEAYADLVGIFWKRTLDVRGIQSPWRIVRTVWGDFRINFPYLNAYLASGFGMDIVALLVLAAVVLAFLADHRFSGASSISGPLTPHRTLLLLAICSVTFWVFLTGRIFPYMHLHALPIVASLFGLAVVLSWARLRDATGGLMRWAGALALAACFVPMLDRLSYVREYPNLLDPKRVWLMEVPREEMIEGLEVSRKVKEKTSYGDIVMVPFRGLWDGGREVNPLYEYYSQRRNEPLGRTIQEFAQRRAFLESYRTKIRAEQGANIKLFALFRNDDDDGAGRSALYRHLLSLGYGESLAGGWTLAHLDQPPINQIER